MAQRHTSKGRAIAGHSSKRVIKAADRANGATSSKAGKTYSSTRLGAECGKIKGERAC